MFHICEECRKKYYDNEEYLKAKMYEVRTQKTIYMCIHTYNSTKNNNLFNNNLI